VKAKVQGTVVLKVVIGADGRAQKISVQRRFKDWKFRPAAGPDGNPAAVVQTVETTLHLYEGVLSVFLQISED
jgi:hypothetical protein